MWRPRPGDARSDRHSRHYHLIAEMGQVALGGGPLAELFASVTARLQQGLEVDACAVFEHRPDGSFLLTGGAGWSSAHLGHATLAGQDTQAAYTLATDGPVVVTEYDRETRFQKALLLDEHQIVSGVSVPIRGRGGSYGVVAAFTRERRLFSDTDIHIVQALANILAEALEFERAEAELETARVLLDTRTREHSEALEQTSVRLRQSEELLRALFDDASAGVVLTDFEGRFLEANEAFARMLGYRQDELRGMQTWDLDLPAEDEQDAELERRHFEELIGGERGNYQLDKRLTASGGTAVWVQVATSLVRDAAGRPLCGLSTIQDITERKRAEMALRQSQERFQTIFKSGPVASCITTFDDGRILDINTQFEQITGIRRQDALGRTVEELSIWLEPDKRRAMIDTVRRCGSAHKLEVPIRHKTGVDRVVLASYERIELDGQDHLLAMFEDISERTKLEHELAEARLRLVELREQERLDLARELHDGTVQQLIGVSYGLYLTRKHVLDGAAQPEGLTHSLDEHREHVLDAVEQLRALIRDLRPAGLKELGLVATMENFVAQLKSEVGPTGPELLTRLELAPADLNGAAAVCLLRVAQEALRNAVKHARAKRVTLTLGRSQDALVLEVCDDGKGFVIPKELDTLANDGHFGLVGMQERVSSVGGVLNLRSTPGQGTSVSARVPHISEEIHG